MKKHQHPSERDKRISLPRYQRATRAGFALIATLLILILLVVIAFSMMSLSSVSVRDSSQSSAIMEARANARLGLMIAIGELQASMGPDRRISGRAGLIASDPRVSASISDNTPKSWWVGVVGSDPSYGLDATTAVSASNPAAVWLVSGLNPQQNPATQILQAQPFINPVVMLDNGSIDTASLTGGAPITAGIVTVPLKDSTGTGGYAYWIDDEGLKAQLAPANKDLVNTTTPASSGDLTPGAYDVSILDGMSALDSNPLSNYSKILSIGDLELLAGGTDLSSSKRFAFTTYSRGVLSDVKNGGLKRDLTVAFENEATFNEVFPRGSGAYTANYLCINPAKLALTTDLQTNGYIHWDVFKDYYNTKRHIKTHADGTKYLDPVRYSKAGVYTWNNGGAPPGWAVNPTGQPSGGSQGSLLMAGRLGPHDIGDAVATQYPQMLGMPYGNYRVMVTTPRGQKNSEEFKHSPVIPILQRVQANAWLEYIDPRTLRSHAQMWSSHYNPYNISLNIMGDDQGPRILGAPRIIATTNPRLRFIMRNPDGSLVTFGGTTTVTYMDRESFTHNKHQFHAVNAVMAKPGRSHVMAFERSGSWDESVDGFLYNDVVKDLTVESINKDFIYVTQNPVTGAWDVPTNLPANMTVSIGMALQNTSLHHGSDDNLGGGGNEEVSQSFWAPFAWDNVGGRPGKNFNLGSVPTTTLNENRMVSLNLNLRTTRETDGGIRPLVDGNIRCLLGNTRWDSPLNIPALAIFSTEDQGVADEMIMQMDTSNDPKGYTYWGAGREPSFGFERVILFDIPRSDLVSLGQLQHANAGRFSYEPTYVAGNSYANPRISQTNWRESITDTFSTTARGLANFRINGAFNLYDSSYLVNEVLWDSYTFTTIPQMADNVTNLSEPAVNAAHFQNLVNGSAKLANARYLPYSPLLSSFNQTTLQMTSNRAAKTGAFYHNAGHLLIDGAFNVNSTSVDAWEAFLSSTHSLPVAKTNETGVVTGFDTETGKVRFPRVQTAFGEGVEKDSLDENFWIGFRELKQTEVRELAEAIVDEVEKRGPFLSMADFVNRELVTGELGEAGALQAALDKTVNTGIDADFARDEQAAGFPGQLLQGDLLQALAPRMTVRSDTFTIRAYGESIDSAGKVLARTWCEARVQRFPDPVDSDVSGGSPLSELANPTSPYGRNFRIISFRWLNPDEI